MTFFPSLSGKNMEWYQKMIDTYNNSLSDDELKELAEWENQNLGNSERSTSDWPGWIKYIDLPPWKIINN